MNPTTDSLDKKSRQSVVGSNQTLHVKIVAPYKIYFNEGDVQSISAENDTGPFDILLKHHNFITLLSPCELLVRTVSGDQRIRISKGLMHVKSNNVTIFLDI